MKIQLEFVESVISKEFLSLCSLQKSIVEHPKLTLDEQIESTTQDEFEYHLNCLHYQLCLYLNLMNLNDVREIFNETFVNNFSMQKAFSEIEPDPDGYQTYNAYLLRMHRFLKAFHFYPFRNIGIGVDPTAIMILERILKNTESIIIAENKNPKTETKVYNAVKSVVHAVFPTSKKPGSNFSKIAQVYKPDILIPEIKTAVEYKYAKSVQTLKTTLDQVYADTGAYTGDTDYENFYAVFYVTKDFWGLDRFKKIWKEKKFPPHWKGFYIVGH